jgi:uncharacterized protein YndB with AHSA1/START domain
MSDKFVYVTYIRTTQEKVWEALTKPEFTRQFWYGIVLESSWKEGEPWKMVAPDGAIYDAGEVLEVEKPRHLVLSWRHQMRPELKAEGEARCTIDLETTKDMVKLTVTHEMARTGSKLIAAVSGGWPGILSSLKSYLETGKALERV